MDEPYTHGSYINQKRMALIADAGVKLSVQMTNADDVNKALTRDLNKITAESQHDLNEQIANGPKIIAEQLKMEPHVLDYMLTDLLGDMWNTDEYIRDTVTKLLIYVKMHEADAIAAYVKQAEDHKRECTEQNLRQHANTFRTLKEKAKKRLDHFDNDIAGRQRDMTSYKEWFIERVNRAFAMARNVEHMSEEDQKVMRGLEHRELLGKDGDYTLINRDKIMFMDSVEFATMITELGTFR